MEYAIVCDQMKTIESFDSNNNERPKALEYVHDLKNRFGVIVLFLIALFFILLPLLLWILSIYLAYSCYKGHMATQVVAVLSAIFFPLLYLLFYFIVHVLLQYPCSSV